MGEGRKSRKRAGTIVHLTLNVPYGITSLRVDLERTGDIGVVGWKEGDIHGDHDIAVLHHPKKWVPKGFAEGSGE